MCGGGGGGGQTQLSLNCVRLFWGCIRVVLWLSCGLTIGPFLLQYGKQLFFETFLNGSFH